MSAKKSKIDFGAMDMLGELGGKVKQAREKEREKEPFKKPRSDYYQLDLIVRDTEKGPKGHQIMTENIKCDYKAYINSVKGSMSITKYIHMLLDEDMKKNKG